MPLANHCKKLMSQNELAEKLKIGVEAVSRMERGLTNLSICRLYELSEIFSCSLIELLQETSTIYTEPNLRIQELLCEIKPFQQMVIIQIIEKMCALINSK